jgi:NADH dehydrogenase
MEKAMAHFGPLEGKLVVLIGGGGFLGTPVAQQMLQRGARLRIAERNLENAVKLKPMANLGQLQFTRCNVKDRRSIANAVQGADVVAYLVGTFGRDQQALQSEGPGIAAELAAAEGAQAFAYVSAIGADAASPSNYARTKAEGEQRVLSAFSSATILRPSILFGEEDSFINRFAGLIAGLPVMPVFGAETRLQPLWVDDAAEAVTTALADPATHGGKTYELAGPEIVTMQQLNERIAAAQGRERRFIAVPDGLARIFAALPGTPISVEQLALLQRGSVASGQFPGTAELGITPRPMGLFLDRWMLRYRKYGRFSTKGEPA